MRTRSSIQIIRYTICQFFPRGIQGYIFFYSRTKIKLGFTRFAVFAPPQETVSGICSRIIRFLRGLAFINIDILNRCRSVPIRIKCHRHNLGGSPNCVKSLFSINRHISQMYSIRNSICRQQLFFSQCPTSKEIMLIINRYFFRDFKTFFRNNFSFNNANCFFVLTIRESSLASIERNGIYRFPNCINSRWFCYNAQITRRFGSIRRCSPTCKRKVLSA